MRIYLISSSLQMTWIVLRRESMRHVHGIQQLNHWTSNVYHTQGDSFLIIGRDICRPFRTSPNVTYTENYQPKCLLEEPLATYKAQTLKKKKKVIKSSQMP